MPNTYWVMEERQLQIYLERLYNATAEERHQAAVLFGKKVEQKNILSVAGDTATIEIIGHLSANGPSDWDLFFGYGGTGYNQINAALSEIASYREVKNIVLKLDTPGGSIDGIDEVYQRIFALRKNYKITAENHGLTASGGYYLAAAAHKIIGTTPVVMTGSIGVRTAWFDFTGMMKQDGVKRVELLSANAPKKTISTKVGIAAVQAELNSLERIFMQRISEGRGRSVEDIKKNFGQGGILVALDPDETVPDALSVGMIDEVWSKKESSTDGGFITAESFGGG